MPVFGAHEHLTDIHHAHHDAEKNEWAVGLHAPRPHLLVGLTVDQDAYVTFENSVPRLKWNRRVPRGQKFETFFTTFSNSSLDIVTPSTALNIGLRLDSLIPPAAAGTRLFNVARMTLVGSFFGKYEYDDPVTRELRYHRSITFVAEASENHVSLATMHALKVHRESTFSRAATLFIPQNSN